MSSSLYSTPSKFTVIYGGKSIEATVTGKSSVTDEWVREITRKYVGDAKVVVGLDVEWKPTFILGTITRSETLQLCINDKCLILQLFYMDQFPMSLKNFFMDSNFTFVGVEIEKDVSKLGHEYGLKFKNSHDIGELAKAYMLWTSGNYWLGLKELSSNVCGMYLEKPERRVTGRHDH